MEKIRSENARKSKIIFPYCIFYDISKIKNVEGYRWLPVGKYRTFLNADGNLKKILKMERFT